MADLILLALAAVQTAIMIAEYRRHRRKQSRDDEEPPLDGTAA